MYKNIHDYGIVGNLQSVALVGLDGSIDWMCLPYLDSPSVFGALLDDHKGGRFAITPTYHWDSHAKYIPQTNVLTTRFRTGGGTLLLTDFMPILFYGEEQVVEGEQELYRLIEVEQGVVDVRVFFQPRFDYARTKVTIMHRNGAVMAQGGDESMVLASSRPLEVTGDSVEARWQLREGERVWLHLRYGHHEPLNLDIAQAEHALEETKQYWRSWLARNETGRLTDLGPYHEMLERSALVLKLLYYEPTGAIAAAATTSLPEEIGGERNFDYRYSWIRDTSFTLEALFRLGHLSEMHGYLRWLERLLAEHGAAGMRVMYGLRGEEELPEQVLDHFDGYKASRPVRIGNAAAGQKQLDIYGEIMDTALKLANYVGKIDTRLWPVLRSICEYVVDHWHEKDFGIWEVRSGPHHFVSSKVMCWVALDRGAKIARRYGFEGDIAKWEKTRDAIKRDVLEKGWNEEKQTFVQHYDSDDVDATNLLIPLVGFLSTRDPKAVSTIEVTWRELEYEGLLYRYKTADGFSGEEGSFLFCTFWMIDNLIALGRLDDAEVLLRRIERAGNHVGLFSEEYDFRWNEALGNFPQAFTHIGYINSVIQLREAREARVAPEKKPVVTSESWQRLLAPTIPLNTGKAVPAAPREKLATELKDTMNRLRGAFVDIKTGRIAYEKIKTSDLYQEYVQLSHALRLMNLAELESWEEKVAFWINLYNVLVIHGIIELDIESSMNEVRDFFGRIQYQIGDLFFTPDDIEHGILRHNSRAPNSIFRPFSDSDPRREFMVDRFDPRIHFTLVCGSAFCPPIEVYTADDIDNELNIATRTFINAGNVELDRRRGRIYLSRMFKWHGKDFGETAADRIRYISLYMHDKEVGEFLMHYADELDVYYQDYDWRLNRY